MNATHLGGARESSATGRESGTCESSLLPLSFCRWIVPGSPTARVLVHTIHGLAPSLLAREAQGALPKTGGFSSPEMEEIFFPSARGLSSRHVIINIMGERESGKACISTFCVVVR